MPDTEPLVAPPRGERGLKLSFRAALPPLARRSPSWGAWIETDYCPQKCPFLSVAPPRGERGLKLLVGLQKCNAVEASLPLVGSVD